MRRLPLLASLVLLVACGGDTGFSAGDNSNDELRGTGSVQLYPADQLSWEGLWPGIACSQYMRLESIGDSDLIIDRVDIVESGGGVFTMSEVMDEVVNPGEAFEFTVQATLSDPADATGELRIRSNDADTPDIRIPLVGAVDPDWTEGDTGTPDC
ncbi:MAG: hypothetical protein H6742_01170 [Alphaproteobacteria bacterium]|nr:hypothetical protein [Alphaproteobacteria bacterium]